MKTNDAVRINNLAADIASQPSFPALPFHAWAEVEMETSRVLEGSSELTREDGGLEACYAYAEALYGRGDECGSEEVWHAILPEAAARESHDLAAYCAARLSRCALDFQDHKAGLDLCRRGKALARHLPAEHPVHQRLALESGRVLADRQDWEGARRALAMAASAPPVDAELAQRWEGRTHAELKCILFNTMAELALERSRKEPPRLAEGLLQEAWGWLHKCHSLPQNESTRTLTLVHEAEVNWRLGDSAGSLLRLDGWLQSAPAQDPALGHYMAPVLRLKSLLALAQDDLPEALRLVGQACDAAKRYRFPRWERQVLRALVRIYTEAHERRYSGHREHTVLKTLDGGGSWILDLVEFVETRDAYISGRHSRFVHAACLALCPPPETLDRPGIPENLYLPYLLGAASLHDIGKLDVPWSLLNRIRPLGLCQKERLQAHVLAGSRLLEHLGFPMTARLVEEHHERADGQGYPFGTRYQSLSGSFLALAEALIALSQPSRPSPTPASLLENARWCLQDGASRFQPQALAALHRAVENGNLLDLQAALSSALSSG